MSGHLASGWRVLSVGLVLALLSPALACSIDLPDPRPPAPFTLCSTSTSCLPDRVCEAGFCVVASDKVEKVSIQVSPFSDADLPQEQFPAVQLAQNSPLPDLVLREPTQISGLVEVGGDNMGALRARLRFSRRQPSIAGRDLTFSVTADASNGYFLRVPPGYYDVSVAAQDRALPPLAIFGLPIASDTQLPIVFDPTERYATITGQAVFVDAAFEAPDVVQEPVMGARVRAIDRDLNTVSTIGVSDESGSFTILVRRDVVRYDLVLSPPQVSEDQTLPTTVFTGLELVGDDVNIGVRSFGRLFTNGRGVQGQIRASNGARIVDGEQNIDGAELIFRAVLGDTSTPNISTQFVTSVTADEQGRYDVSLQPGTYTVLVTPPVSSEFAITEFAGIKVTPPATVLDLGAFRLRMNDKTTIQGRILDPEGNRLRESSLVFIELLGVSGVRALIPEAARSGQRSLTLVTNPDGTFELPLDPGEYRIQAIPPDEAGVARSLPRTFRVRGVPLDLELCTTAPNVAYGRVFDNGGRALVEAKVELFRTEPETERGVWLLGAGRTNQEGFYRVLIPELCDEGESCESSCP